MTDDARPDIPAVPSAAALRSYMRATGWHEGPHGTAGSLWSKNAAGFAVPHDDGEFTLRGVIARLAAAEGRTLEETAAAIAAYRDARAATKPCGCGPLEPCGEHLGRGPVASVSAPAAESPAPAPPVPSATEPHMLLLEMAFGIIANAGWDAFSGNVDLPKTTGWHEAAIRWRDDYHGWLDLHLRPGGWQSWEELATSLCRERDAFFAENERLKRELRDATSGTAIAIEEPGRWRERAEQAEAKLAEVRQRCQEAAGIADLITRSGGKPITASPLIDAILAITGTGEEGHDG